MELRLPAKPAVAVREFGDRRFQVTAANEDGLWNEAGASVDIAIGSSALGRLTIAEKVTAGVSNDDQRLRLVVATPDPMIIERLQIAGLMVYVDPKNRKSQAWAVRVPPLGRVLRGEKPDPHVTYVEVFGPGMRPLVDTLGTLNLLFVSGTVYTLAGVYGALALWHIRTLHPRLLDVEHPRTERRNVGGTGHRLDRCEPGRAPGLVGRVESPRQQADHGIRRSCRGSRRRRRRRRR